MDYQISRIIDTLKARGLYDNTIIFFSSDHGEMLGDFGTMGKRSMLDGALRIRSCPRPRSGRSAAQRCLLARGRRAHALSLAGIEYCGEHFDGIDLLLRCAAQRGLLAVQHRKEGRLHRLVQPRQAGLSCILRIAGITSTACRRIPTAMMHPTPAYASCAPCWSSTCRRTAAQTAEEARTFLRQEQVPPTARKRGDHLARREEELAKNARGV